MAWLVMLPEFCSSFVLWAGMESDERTLIGLAGRAPPLNPWLRDLSHPEIEADNSSLSDPSSGVAGKLLVSGVRGDTGFRAFGVSGLS